LFQIILKPLRFGPSTYLVSLYWITVTIELSFAKTSTQRIAAKDKEIREDVI
jgi:hypothetical protein